MANTPKAPAPDVTLFAALLLAVELALLDVLLAVEVAVAEVLLELLAEPTTPPSLVPGADELPALEAAER